MKEGRKPEYPEKTPDGYGSRHDVYDAMKCFSPHNMYVYFLCGLVCTCIHESDAKLICMCFSQTF